MQADYEFYLLAKGTEEEIKKNVTVLSRGNNRNNDFLFLDPRVSLPKGWKSEALDITDENSIHDFCAASCGKLEFSAMGPFGKLSFGLDYVFNAIAEAVPHAYFSGSIEGGTSYTRENIYCEVKDARMYIKKYYACVEDFIRHDEDEGDEDEEYSHDDALADYMTTGGTTKEYESFFKNNRWTRRKRIST